MQQVPGVPPRPVSQNRQELRLALSLRGGVSLAVWMGGAIAEIDRLTQTAPRPYDREEVERDGVKDPYGMLLHLTGYTGVAVDVITGASAGGLNAVIYAAAKVYGFDFDDMLRVWVELGDIEALTRSPISGADGGKRTKGNPPSLLQGDCYFLDQLRKNLALRITDPTNGPASTNPIDLILSATLADPVAVLRTDDPYSTIEEERRMASFHFRYAGTTASRAGHFEPPAKAAEISRPDSTASLLALAGRATSSFPGRVRAGVGAVLGQTRLLGRTRASGQPAGPGPRRRRARQHPGRQGDRGDRGDRRTRTDRPMPAVPAPGPG